MRSILLTLSINSEEEGVVDSVPQREHRVSIRVELGNSDRHQRDLPIAQGDGSREREHQSEHAIDMAKGRHRAERNKGGAGVLNDGGRGGVGSLVGHYILPGSLPPSYFVKPGQTLPSAVFKS